MRLKTVVFVCGAVVMSLEMVGSRLIAPSYGNSLYAWGSLIGAILGALSIGYYYGGRKADKNPSFYALSLIILEAGLFISFIPALSGLLLAPSIASLIGMKYGPLVSVSVLFIVPSILLGMVSPYAVKLEAKSIARVGNTAGNLYAISTLGSIFGTFLTVFALVPQIGVRALIFSLGAVLLLTALFCAGRRLIAGTLLASVVLCTLAASTPTFAYADNAGYRILMEKDTAYCEMLIVDSPDSSKRFMFLDRSSVGAAYLNSSEAVYNYTDYFHLPMALSPHARDVLFIGGGAGTGPRRFHGEYPDALIDVVDIDPQVNRAAEKYFNLTQDERLHVYEGDGRYFLSRSAGKYDIIVVDAFSSKSSVPFHLLTREFMSLAKEHLSADGYLLFNVHGSVTGSKNILSAAVWRTAKQVFPNVYVFHVGDEPDVLQNMIILASRSPDKVSREEIVRNSERLAMEGSVKNLGTYAGHYVDENAGYLEAPVLTDDYAPVDNLLLAIYDY